MTEDKNKNLRILADNGETQLVFDPDNAYCFANVDSKTGKVFQRSMILSPKVTVFFGHAELRKIKQEVKSLKKAALLARRNDREEVMH